MRSLQDKYEPLIDASVSVETIRKASKETIEYSGIARTLAILSGGYGDNAKQNAVLAQSIGDIADSTFKKAQNALSKGVTADMYKEFRKVYNSVSPGVGKTERALNAFGATGTIREALKELL